MMIIVMGLPGSGKSYFASRLADKLGARYIASDALRKEMRAMGKYSAADKNRIYDRMAEVAKSSLSEGGTLVLDATFFKKDILDKFVSLAREKNVPYRIFWIVAEEEVIKERVSKEREDSEADYQVYLKLAAEFEEPQPPFLTLVSTQNNIIDMLDQADGFIKGSG